jgi:hypothetical protein
MVLLRVVPSSFHARVLAARLGADGIPAELQGAVDGVYPWGDVRVYVTEHDLAVAQELLLADEVESAFQQAYSNSEEARRRVRHGVPPWVAVSVLFLLWMGCMAVWR